MQAIENKELNLIHYYSVYYSKYDRFNIKNDVFGDVRKNYFETGKRQKNKIVKEDNGIIYRYSYCMAVGQAIKWKKMQGSRLIEKSFPNRDGSYTIVQYNDNRKVRKILYFDSNHEWLRSEYYSERVYGKNPEFVISPSVNSQNINISGFDSENNEKYDRVLYIDDTDVNKEELDIINFSMKNSFIRCLTSVGDIVYCDENAKEERNKILDDIRIEPGFFEEGDEKQLESEKEEADTVPVDTVMKNDKSEEKTISSIIESLRNIAKTSLPPENLSVVNEAKSDNSQDDGKEEEKPLYSDDDEIVEKYLKDNEDCYEFGMHEREENLYPFNDVKRPDTAYEYKSLYIDTLKKTADRDIEEHNTLNFKDLKDDLSKTLDDKNFNEQPFVGSITDFSNISDDSNIKLIEKNEVIYAGGLEKGKKEGVGICYTVKDKRIFVANWKDDAIVGKVTEFDDAGKLIYTGYLRNLKRHGYGIEYDGDGNIVYKGQWEDDMRSGKGTLYTADGRMIEGLFKDNDISDYACEYNSKGFKTYEGGWKNGLYNGEGCKYFENGNYCKGTFVDGEPVGILFGYTKNGNLMYKGTWKNYEYSGTGEYYVSGQKVYEGEFLDNCYHGFGYRYKDSQCIFAGRFSYNVRTGLGTSYENGQIKYVGQWKDDKYDGCGMLYENGKLRYVGEFSGGVMNGRINEIVDDRIWCEAVYKNGSKVYVKEYKLPQGTLYYQGSIKDEKKNGVGCTYSEFGDKLCIGYFEDNKFIRSMEVSKVELEPLPLPEEMNSTDYKKYVTVSRFAVEKEVMGGVYSGMLEDGKPNGKGTIAYGDHSYTGEFLNGYACGKGTIYESNGNKIDGIFSSELKEGYQEKIYDNGVKYYFLTFLLEKRDVSPKKTEQYTSDVE